MNINWKYLGCLLLVVIVIVGFFIYVFSFLEMVRTYYLLIILFITLLIILHIFIFLKNLNELDWKVVDYGWLILTIVGVIGISGDIQRYMAESFLKNLEIPRLETSYNHLYDLLKDGSSPNSIFCKEYVYEISEFGLSKEDFDQFKNLRKKQCEDISRIAKQLPNENIEPFIDLSELNLPKNIDSLIDDHYLTTYKQYLDNYNEQYIVYKNTKDKTDLSGFLFYLYLFSPLLICAGLAVRITKATGEILINIRKNKIN